MKKFKKGLAFLLLAAMGLGTFGCGSNAESGTTEEKSQTKTEAQTQKIEKAGDNFIELALNVYYNDSSTGYYKNEKGPSIKAYEEGQYTLTFDCATDLSKEAAAAGVKELKNLTAIYILDAGVAEGNQSPLKACDIFYDKVTVNDTDLTITMTEPKAAFKSSGVFDTNDPINGWDGSCVSEAESDSSHVANFTTVSNPTKISVTFTLSNMAWEEVAAKETTATFVNDSANTVVFSDIDFTNVDAVTFTKYMGNGINLGNTMEAYGHENLGTKASASTYETYWGQPVTTAEMVKAMKNCGFDTLRIPIAWTNMIDYESMDYTIGKEYLDRVEEIVNYALDAEMFVIINDHWDGGWWAMFGSSNQNTVNNAWALYESMWSQIAERFKDYSDMLIFESANEELGDSLNDNGDWADSGSLSATGLYDMTNEINQKFVDIVRNSGGNNDDRFLLIAGYNTNIDKTCDSKFKMPSDKAQNKLIVSVHYYDPWNYCGDKNDITLEKLEGYRWGLKSEYEYMETQVAKMKKFTEAGYGVVIGEYGALPAYIENTSYEIPYTCEYNGAFLDVCDINGFCPVLWSTGNSFDKSTLTMISDSTLELFTSRCYAVEAAEGDAYIEKVKTNFDTAKENAPDMWEGIETYEAGTPVAWIMWNGGAGTYSVGDTFNPADNTVGITATNAVIEGPGEYTVRLDFDGKNTGLSFAALAVADAELLYPGCIVEIKEILINDEPYQMTAFPYTSSDDGKCTRVNIYNGWVSNLPSDARSSHGVLVGCSPCIVDTQDMKDMDYIQITFEFIVKE